MNTGFQHCRIRKAPLAMVARTTFPVDEGIPLRMFLPETTGRKNAVERMHPHVAYEHLPRFLQTEPHLIDRVIVSIAESLPVSEGRCLCPIHCRNRNICSLFQRITFIGVVFHSQIILQQGNHPIDSPFIASTLHIQGPILCQETEPVFTRTIGLTTYTDIPFFHFRVCSDGQDSPTDTLYEQLQQVCCFLVHFTLLRNHDTGDRISTTGKLHLCRQHTSHAKERN